MKKFLSRKRGSWVEVGIVKDLEGIIPVPVPAQKAITDAYRNTKQVINYPDNPSGRTRTVKGCMPFFDAMTEGIALPLPFEMHFIVEDSGKNVNFQWNYAKGLSHDFGVETHHIDQHSSVYENLVFKIPMPYYIKTSDDLLALYMPMMNRPDQRITPFSGLVNHGSDGYTSKVNLPSYWSGPDGAFDIPQGEFIAQVIFVPRKKYKVSSKYISFDEMRERDKSGKIAFLRENSYRDLYRADRK